MSKAVLISIQPKWCELIANGRKTIEVRKTKPNIPTPFKVYIYCTKSKDKIFWQNKLYRYIDDRSHNLFDKPLNGKVIGEFSCDRIECFCVPYPAFQAKMRQNILETSCLTYEQLHRYARGDTLYAWHISDLKIYDKPKELSEFHHLCKNLEEYEGEVYCDCFNCDYGEDSDYGVIACRRTIIRPPQSWCYVERLEGEE